MSLLGSVFIKALMAKRVELSPPYIELIKKAYHTRAELADRQVVKVKV